MVRTGTFTATLLRMDWWQFGYCAVIGCVLSAVANAAIAAPPPGHEAAIAALQHLGAKVRLGKDGEVTYIGFPRDTDDRRFAATGMYLAEIGQFEALGLGFSKVTDKSLPLVGQLDIKRLYLQKTGVTSAGMKHLTGMNDLRILWLFRTSVDDDALVHLAKLPKLNYLHLLETKVTDAGVNRLKDKLPKCSVLR